MKFKSILFLIVFLITTQLSAFQLPKRMLKKVQKELVKTYDNKELKLVEIVVADAVNTQLGKSIAAATLYQIVDAKKVIGFAYVGTAPSKTDHFEYLIILDKELIIKKSKVLVYREDYGGEIGSRRWLKQFIGKSSKDQLKYRRDIMAISGATISAVAMTQAINQFLADVAILQQNNIF
jgi:Na+-translocating ferredoxin:NAD+ oxidoreductase RnfG subunit